MDTVIKNIMLDKFMGNDVVNDLQMSRPNGGAIFFSDLQYHTSWDWLMPVLKKINLIGINEDEWKMIICPTKYPIEKVYEQATQFIEWYNENKKP